MRPRPVAVPTSLYVENVRLPDIGGTSRVRVVAPRDGPSAHTMRRSCRARGVGLEITRIATKHPLKLVARQASAVLLAAVGTRSVGDPGLQGNRRLLQGGDRDVLTKEAGRTVVRSAGHTGMSRSSNGSSSG